MPERIFVWNAIIIPLLCVFFTHYIVSYGIMKNLLWHAFWMQQTILWFMPVSVFWHLGVKFLHLYTFIIWPMYMVTKWGRGKIQHLKSNNIYEILTLCCFPIYRLTSLPVWSFDKTNETWLCKMESGCWVNLLNFFGIRRSQ